MLKKTLESVLSTKESDELISAFDQIGHIIIIRIPDSLTSKKKLIGETLLDQVKSAKSIFYQSSSVDGEFRTRDLEILAGEDKTETEYKESGCRFFVDVRNVFFSPRLSSERTRIAEFVNDGEVMVNMFGGVGIFSIIAAKMKKCTVFNIDINPFATKLCKKNIAINRLVGNVISIHGDASQVINSQLENKSDRTLMLLPEKSDRFELESVGADIVIRGNNAISLSSGFHWYLKHVARCQVSWNGDQLNLPSPLPTPKKTIHRTSQTKYGFYFNYCTFCHRSVCFETLSNVRILC
jgi:tRNA (guanine37-N1)-methyltransferase